MASDITLSFKLSKISSWFLAFFAASIKRLNSVCKTSHPHSTASLANLFSTKCFNLMSTVVMNEAADRKQITFFSQLQICHRKFSVITETAPKKFLGRITRSDGPYLDFWLVLQSCKYFRKHMASSYPTCLYGKLFPIHERTLGSSSRPRPKSHRGLFQTAHPGRVPVT